MDIRKDFPIFKNRKHGWVYLDSSATTQKPKVVIDAVKRFYEAGNAPVHRSDYLLGNMATDAYEKVRSKVSSFLQVASNEIIFTKNTNEALNIVAKNCSVFLDQQSVVVLSRLEHNANVVPWLFMQQHLKFKIHWLDFDANYRLKYEVPPDILEHVRVVSLAHVSNVTGTINPLKDIFAYFRHNVKRPVICVADGAQAVGHFQVNLNGGDKTTRIDPDYYAFSAHKMYAPSGVGVLYAKTEPNFPIQPLILGSHMIADVAESGFELAELPDRMEAGTPNMEGVYGLGEAIDYLWSIGWGDIEKHEKELIVYALEKFKDRKCVLYGARSSVNRIGVFSFGYEKIHTHDVAQGLDTQEVCVRAGKHCADVFMKAKDISGTVRASCGVYTTKKDIDALMEGLAQVEDFFHV